MSATVEVADASQVAEVEVICPGMLEVLSVGKGDIKLTVGGSDPEEVDKARRVIEEMLRKGYAIYVETDTGVRRVKKFNKYRLTYIIAEVAEPEPAPPEPEPESGKPKPATRKAPVSKSTKASTVVEREVPLAGSRAKAVGRTAGG